MPTGPSTDMNLSTRGTGLVLYAFSLSVALLSDPCGLPIPLAS